MNNRLTCSIVTWNSAESIKECIETVLQQTFKDYKLVIVDNNSHDETCRIIREFNDPRINLIPLKENTGFCGGHNYTINQLDTEFLLLVNPDAKLFPQYLENAMDRITKDPKIGTVCGLLLQSDEKNPLIDSAGMDLKKDGRFVLRYHGQRRDNIKLVVAEVSGADGALPLYRKKMIDEIRIDGKFFDEMFFAHKEDWDVSWRAGLLGWKTVFDPQCVAIHPRSFKQGNLKTRSSMSSIIKFHAVKNQLLLILKNEQNIAGNFINIMFRQLIIFIYSLIFERKSLQAFLYVFNHRKEILQTRKIIKEKIVNKKLNSNLEKFGEQLV